MLFGINMREVLTGWLTSMSVGANYERTYFYDNPYAALKNPGLNNNFALWRKFLREHNSELLFPNPMKGDLKLNDKHIRSSFNMGFQQILKPHHIIPQ